MYAIIACGVFKDEIEEIADDLGFPARVRYLEAGLHVDFDGLAEALKRELEDCRGFDGIIVAFGECHPRIAEILAPYNAVLLRCQNCIDALITRKKVEEIANRGLYFYLSPGWVKGWRDMFERMSWSQEEARFQLAPFKGAIFLDTLGNAQDYEEGLIEFLDFTLCPYEKMPVDLAHFRALILEAKERCDLGRGA
jgi:hypothetical protein